MAISKEPLFTKPTTTIFICTMIIRALTIGYVIGGFVMRFELFYLEKDIVKILDYMPLGLLPLGSTLMFLVYSLMPFLILYAIVGGVGLIIIVRRSKWLLLAHAIGHSALMIIETVYLSLISWIVHESADNSTMTKGFETAHEFAFENEWRTLFEKLSCCGVSGKLPETSTVYWNLQNGPYGCFYNTGCLDKIKHFTSTYGGYYVAVISINIVTSVVCLAITEYFFRVAELKHSKEENYNELYKCRNGILGELYKKSSTIWKRNKLVWFSTLLKSIDLVYEVSLAVSVLILSHSWLRDYYLQDVIYNLWKDGLSMGYLEHVLTHTFLCVLAVSMGLKFLNFAAVNRKSGILMIAYIIAEFFLLLVEIIIFIFFTFLIRMLYCCITGKESYYCHFSNTDSADKLCNNTQGIWLRAARNIWLAFGFFLLHLAIKISHLAMADRLFKSINTGKEKQTVGFLHFLLLKIKRKPLVAGNIGVGVFTMVFSTVFLCGLLVVRYDLNAYTRISSTLHGISDSLGNIGDIRDTSYILMIVTLILTTLLQIVLFVGVYFEKHYLLTSSFGFQIFLLLPHIISLFMIVVPLKMIYCCIEGVGQCNFSSDKDDLNFLCSGQTDLWISTAREIWLFWSFTLASLSLQFFSMALCWKLHRKLFSETICMRHFKRIYIGVISNPKIFIESLTVFTLVFEIAIGIATYAYFFEKIYPAYLQQFLGRFTYHGLNMQYLMNGLTYTLMAIIPVSIILRPLLLWLILLIGKLQVSFLFVVSYLAYIVGELAMLILSSFLLNLTYTCVQRESSYYTEDIVTWKQFCDSCKGDVHSMEAIKMTFLTIHLILNTIYVILVDRVYPILMKDEENKGVLKILKAKISEVKVQSSFKAVQWLGIVVDASYCIAVYTLYFVNFYPFDQFVQQDLNAFEKHRYDMQDLLNALTYTLMSLIPLTLFSRVAVICFGLHTRSFFIYIMITILFVLLGGYIVLITQSSYLLDLAYNCYDRFFSHYSSTKFSSFCDTNVGLVFDIAAVYVSYLVLQIIISVLSIIMLDRLYSYLGDISVSNGAFRSAFGRLYSSLKSSKMNTVFFVILCLMLIIRLLFWIGLILMGLSPGYIHTDLIDTLHSMHIGNLNYGTMSMGLMYSHMALVPVDIACHGLELLAVIKMNKTLLIMSILMRIIWIASDVTTLSFSSTILHLGYCLCGPGPVCLSSLYYSFKQEVCRNSYLLFHASGTLVAYLVVNFCSHIFELTVCSILSKKASTKISPNERMVNGTRDHEESLEIGSFDDDL